MKESNEIIPITVLYYFDVLYLIDVQNKQTLQQFLCNYKKFSILLDYNDNMIEASYCTSFQGFFHVIDEK